MKWNRLVSMVMIALFMISGGFVITNHASSPAKAVGAAIVNIAFDEPSVVADVAPGKDGIVTLTGTVTCTLMANPGNVQSVQVSLVASCAWPASISPAAITFAGADLSGKPKAFSVAVLCPPQESIKSSQQLQVSGEWRTYPGASGGQVAGATATIKIKQFYKFSISCQKPFQEVTPGTPVTYTLKINNEGNGRDTFQLLVKDIPKGWSVQLGQTSVDIEEKKSQVVTVTVTPPQEFHAWINQVTTITVLVSSKVAMTAEKMVLQEPYYLFIRQKGFSAPGFEPMLTAMAMILALGIIMFQNGRRREDIN